MATVKTDDQNYINIANAIRQTLGIDDTFLPSEMDDAIFEIPKVGTWVTPEMFGAVGDGVTDDTLAVQEAMQNRCVMLKGDYLITSAITAAAQIVSGNGTIRGNYGLTFSNKINLSNFNMVIGNHVDVIAITCQDDVIIDGISIEGGKEGIYNNVNGKIVEIKNSRFTGMWGDTCRAIHISFAKVCNIHNNIIENISNDIDRDADGIFVWQRPGEPNGVVRIHNNIIHNCRGRFIKSSTYNADIRNNYCYNDEDFGVITNFTGIDVQKGNSYVENNEIHAKQGINISVRATGDSDSHNVIRKNRIFRVDNPGGSSGLHGFEIVDHATGETSAYIDFSENYIDYGDYVSIQIAYLPNSRYLIKNNTVIGRTSSHPMVIRTTSAFDATCRFEIEGNTCGYAYFVRFTDGMPNCKGDCKVLVTSAVTLSNILANVSYLCTVTGSALEGKFRDTALLKSEGSASYYIITINDEAHYGIYRKNGAELCYYPATS